MDKRSLFLVIALGWMMTASSQTVFTYGKNSVDVKEFLRAYNKNNPPNTNKEKSIRDYLDLYIKSRLKVREAYERRYDTLPHLQREVVSLRSQIIENYMTDPKILERMVREAFQRSQKDIHLAHIFISLKNAGGIVDTAAAIKKRDDIFQQLKKGTDFLQLAQLNSDDPAVKTNKGDIGFITVFTLPYEFENIVYATPSGKYSEAVRSKIGFHIFKNLGERKAVGKIKTQQILLAIPPGADELTKKQIGIRADSLYKRILAGENFNQLATAFSNDYISAATGGNIPDVSVGQYDPAFENALWSLTKDGAVSKPVLTSHGWHILKRVSVKPVISDPEDKANLKDLEQKIMADNRWKTSGDYVYNQVITKVGVKKHSYNEAALWAYADSLLNMQPMRPEGRTIDGMTPMFSVGKLTYDVNAFITYARTYRFRQDGSGAKPHNEARDDWEKHVMLNYYRDNLEDFNEEFRNQMAEFRDGNLFFEIMQQEVWNKAQGDSTALLELYNKNKQNYVWKQSADVVIYFCTDQASANIAYEAAKKKPYDWRNIIGMYSEKVMGDSARYEWSQIPNLGKTVPKAGMITTPEVNTADNTVSFAYIIKSYPQSTQRTFNEARGLVTNDYQEILEKEWNEVLKKKYPVVVDEKVLQSISK